MLAKLSDKGLNMLIKYFTQRNNTTYCKFGYFCEGFIFAKLHICEVL